MKFDVNVHYPNVLIQARKAVSQMHVDLDPDDIAHAVTLRVLENNPDMEFPNTYTDRAVRNQILMGIKNRAYRDTQALKARGDETEVEANFILPTPNYDDKLLCEQLLAHCTPEERYYFKRKADGLDWGEIAAEVGLTLPAVKTTVHRARAKMAKRANFKILKAAA